MVVNSRLINQSDVRNSLYFNSLGENIRILPNKNKGNKHLRLLTVEFLFIDKENYDLRKANIFYEESIKVLSHENNILKSLYSNNGISIKDNKLLIKDKENKK